MIDWVKIKADSRRLTTNQGRALPRGLVVTGEFE